MNKDMTAVLDNIRWGRLDWDDIEYLQAHKEEAKQTKDPHVMELAGVSNDEIRKLMRDIK